MYYMMDAKIPTWLKIKVSLISLSSVLQPRVKRRDLLTPPPTPPQLSIVQDVLQTTSQWRAVIQLAASLFSRRKHTKKIYICLNDRAMIARGMK